MSVHDGQMNVILDVLEDLGFNAPTIEGLEEALADVLSPDYTFWCSAMATEISALDGLSSAVSNVEQGEDASIFRIEMSSFLEAFGCCYSELDGSAALDSYKSRVLLLEYLGFELASSRINAYRRGASDDVGNRDCVQKSNTELVTTILNAVQVSPLTVATESDVVAIIQQKVNEACMMFGPDYIKPPLLLDQLNPTQRARLDTICDELSIEYSVRRQMLLKRCDVTVQSFTWSEKVKSYLTEIHSVVEAKRVQLSDKTRFSVDDVLYASEDLTQIHRITGNAVRIGTASKINKIAIGAVPDRGGRPDEKRPAAEMPRFRKRTAGPAQLQRDRSSRGGRGRGGGASRGRGRGENRSGGNTKGSSHGRKGGGSNRNGNGRGRGHAHERK